MSRPLRLVVRTVAFHRVSARVSGCLPPITTVPVLPSRSGITRRALHSVREEKAPPAPSPEAPTPTILSKKSVPVSTKSLLSGLRDLQTLDSLIPDTTKKNNTNFKSALKAVSLLTGCDGGRSKPTVSLAELERVIPFADLPVVWKVMRSLAANKPLPEMAALDDKWRAMVLFCRVHGIGKARAENFANLGLRTLDELANTKEGKWKISRAQRLAIKYHEDMEIMIPRSEVDELNVRIKKALAKADPMFDFAIMGSYRRGEAVSSDVDVVIWHPSFVKRDVEENIVEDIPGMGSFRGKDDRLMATVLTAFEDAGLLEESKIFSKGGKKVLALTRLPTPNSIHRQIDIRLCPVESLPYMLLGNTGDNELMKTLRSRALTRGLVLNEYEMGQRKGRLKQGVIKKGTEIIVKSEKEIFHLLGLSYLEPHQRGKAVYRNIPWYKERSRTRNEEDAYQ
ncbi:hypothetical protein IAT38_004735 [Cryptococcus sp. DSM 104549]